jgi:hypothetical protein
VDVAPLLLTLATGSNAWRNEPRYAHVARRHDLVRMVLDPTARGRAFVLHATDEIVSEFAVEPYAANAPLHVVAVRTPTAKYALYSNWQAGSDAILTKGQERELYDYTSGGTLEIDNRAGRSNLEQPLDVQLARAVRDELREPVPTVLRAAQQDGYADYHTTAQTAAIAAAAQRRRIEESEPRSKAAEKLGMP